MRWISHILTITRLIFLHLEKTRISDIGLFRLLDHPGLFKIIIGSQKVSQTAVEHFINTKGGERTFEKRGELYEIGEYQNY